ncbi:alpha/beta fold hydrolase [Ralstonia soli]|uniref:Alpha/beta fold hydrolase n=1 Tax=Ralstonia soli TaxID=2953896 RepID=A0ABT1AMR6_9RALS|nr:alpha/beta fold hydrolase [Ralstonia soli]MCO5399718.1 alpha/beta fold hydrolase [Ralstonia soli]
MEICTVDLDGVSTRYVSAGKTGETVIFLHGGTPASLLRQNAFIWERNLDALGEEFRVLAPDLLGMGHTRVAPDAVVTIEQMTKHASKFADVVCPGPVHLVGHDEGGIIALNLAYASPARVSSVTLVGSRAAPTGDGIASLALAGCPSPSADRHGQAWLMERMSFSETHIGEGAFLEDVASVSATKDLAPEAVVTMKASISRAKSVCFAKFRDEGFPAPIQLIWGLQDQIIPIEHAFSLYGLLLEKQPSAHLRIVNRAGNLVFRERAAEFNGLIRSFIGVEASLIRRRHGSSLPG